MKKAMPSLGQAPQLHSGAAQANNSPLSRRTVLGSGLAWGLGLGPRMGAATAVQEPAPQTEIWVDPARSRDIPVLLRWPQASPQGVVIYSHGLGGKKEGGDVWGRSWAAAGMLVLHLQHAGSDAASLRGGFSALRKAMSPEQLAARVQDVRFVVAELQRRRLSGQPAWSRVPVDRIAVAGHSFGARSTLVAAGWQRQAWGSLEPQAKAFIAFSPALGQGVGLALWDAAREGLQDEGCTHVSIWVPIANDRAMRFHELAGFKREMSSAKTVPMGPVKVEEIRLKQAL